MTDFFPFLFATGLRHSGRASRSSLRARNPHARINRGLVALAPCSFLLWILTDKSFHSNLAIAPTCDTVSTYHITDNARDPQRGLSRATYLLKVSRRAALPNEEES